MASGVFTCIKFASTILFLLGGVQVFNRKTLMSGGAFFMGAFLFSLGAILKTHPPMETDYTSSSSSSQGMMAFIYLFVVAYSVSWGPLQWVYIGEIFPTRIRDYGMAIGAGNIWLWNCEYIHVKRLGQFTRYRLIPFSQLPSPKSRQSLLRALVGRRGQ